MRIRRIVAAAAVVGTVSAAASFAGPAANASTEPDSVRPAATTAVGQIGADNTIVDFRVPGVIIWESDLPWSGVLGYGYPGQGFSVDAIDAVTSYTCDNGETSWTQLHGYDIATGVTGYVPSCNTTW